MKVYISGPMRGYPNNNRALFGEVARQYRELGHTVYCPSEYDGGHDGRFDMRKAFREYCGWICDHAQLIVMLPGWEASMGATIEHDLARNCNCEVQYWGDPNTTHVIKDLDTVVEARTLKAYLTRYLGAWEAGGRTAHPNITVRAGPNDTYAITVTHVEAT